MEEIKFLLCMLLKLTSRMSLSRDEIELIESILDEAKGELE